MENSNKSSFDFFLLGLFPTSGIGLFLFIPHFLIFLIVLFRNLSMIILILLDCHLHTPMYFLLSQLSFTDLKYISTIVSKMVSDYLLGNTSTSFIRGGVHCFFFVALAGADVLILASMAYDHYVAMCFPLLYPIHMNKKACVLMITGSWRVGSINSCAHTAYVFNIPYC